MSTSRILPITAVALAVVIFLFDTLHDLGMAVAVLYVVVVLMAVGFPYPHGVLVASLGCVALTLSSYAVQHGFTLAEAPLARCLVSLAAIGITTVLALKTQSTSAVLREQARLLDLTHDTIFVRDMNDVIRYWNRGAEELYGWHKHEAVGQVSHQLTQTVFPAPLEAITAELLETGRWEGELVHTKRDGTKVTVLSRWALQRGERGRPVAILETNNDVSERNRAEAALHQAQAELAHVTRVATMGELTASIAHEVNQPLAAIVTNGEAALRWLGHAAPELGEAREALLRTISDGKRASAVILRLRALSKKAEPQKSVLDLNEVIEEAVLLIQREVVSRQVTVHLDLSPLPVVVGDRVQLQQVVINFAINGIQAMAGVIDRPRELRIRSRDEDDHVVVGVQDSGVGIDAAHQDRLFQAFFTTKPEGMGMGLSICRSIIEAHGGRVSAAGNTGPGATFQFTLPASSTAKREIHRR